MSCVNRAQGALKALEFRNLPYDCSKELCCILKRASQLEELSIRAGKQLPFDISKSFTRAPALKKLFLGYSTIFYRDMIRILTCRPTLVDARFLFVIFNDEESPKSLVCLPNLKHLAICRGGRMSLDHGDSMLVSQLFSSVLINHRDG